MDVRIFPDAAALADDAAAFIADRISAAAPRATVGLAGGSTPRATYERLAGHDLDWEHVEFWLSDERWVPPDHADSNGRMASEALGGAARIHRPQWDLGEPETAAAAYEITLDRLFAGRRPDLILLGLGTDGHTASLFPGTRALHEPHRSFVANWVDGQDAWRLTATLPLLHRASALAFLVSGESKSEIVAQIVGRHEPFPAYLAAIGAAETTWFLDADAATGLSGRGGAAS